MFYKITNKESEAYRRFMVYLKKLNDCIDTNNEKIKTIVPFEFHDCVRDNSLFALDGTMYHSFKPLDLSKVNKNWVEDKQWPGFYKPNKRTKIGKEIVKEIAGLKHIIFDDNNNAFGYHPKHKWLIFGHRECGDTILFTTQDGLDDYVPLDGSIEITSVEYKQIVADYEKATATGKQE